MKKVFLVAMIFSTVACTPPTAGTPDVPSATISPYPTTTPTLIIKTETPTLVSTKTYLPLSGITEPVVPTIEIPTTTQTAPGCFNLIYPVNGTIYPSIERVDFTWENQPGARSYVLFLNYPNGIQEKYNISDTSFSQYIKSTKKAETYLWSVAAYDSNGKLICWSITYTFSDLTAIDNNEIAPSLPTNTPIAPPRPAPCPLPTNTPIAPPMPQPTGLPPTPN